MKREEIKSILPEITDEQMDRVMKLYGDSVNKSRAEISGLRANLKEAQDTIASYGDVEAIKREAEGYKAKYEKRQAKLASEKQRYETREKVSEYFRGKKFVNKPTEKYYKDRMINRLGDEANKDKSVDDIFNSLTEGRENIFAQDAPKRSMYASGTGTQTINRKYSPQENMYGIAKLGSNAEGCRKVVIAYFPHLQGLSELRPAV